MAGAEELEAPLAQALERVQVGGQAAAARKDDARALSEHEVAAEADVAEDERHVVDGVARAWR